MSDIETLQTEYAKAKEACNEAYGAYARARLARDVLRRKLDRALGEQQILIRNAKKES